MTLLATSSSRDCQGQGHAISELPGITRVLDADVKTMDNFSQSEWKIDIYSVLCKILSCAEGVQDDK